MAEIVNDIIVNAGMTHNVVSNMIAYDTLVSGAVAWNTLQNVLEGGSAVRTEVKVGKLHVFGGGYAESAVINGSAAEMYVSANGSAHITTIKNGGALYISAGGSATNLNIDKTGTMYIDVNSDTYITGTSHGKSIKVGDGVTSNITIYGYHWMEVASNWTAYDTLVSGGAAWNTLQNVLEGGSAVRTEVKVGELHVLSGGVTESALINGSAAEMYISAYGSADNTTVKNGGALYISAGGIATNLNIDKTGTMYIDVNSDTYITGTSHGKSIKVGDGVTSNITIYGYHWMEVASNWTAYDTLVSGGAAWNTLQNVLEGGSAVRTEVKVGELHVFSGATATDSIINGGLAQMYVSSAGVAENTTLKNGGYVSIASGAVHKGTVTIAQGANFTVVKGGTVDFTVADRSTADGYLINDLSLIKDTPTYTVTVDDNQVSGTYKLAQGADSFTGTITIGDGSVNYGSITVNGADFVYNGVTYSLDQLGGDLTLTISGGAVPSTTVADDLDGNGLADVILRHTKQGFTGAWLTTGDKSVIKWGSLSDIKDDVELLGTGKLYGTGNDGQDIFFADGKSVGAWKVVDGKVTGYQYVMGVNSTTNVLGLGDFNGDGATDILLRSTGGDLGFFGTDGTGWEYLKGLGWEWDIAAVGDLNGDGLDDTVLRHDAGFAGTFLTQADGTVKWANLDTLANAMSIVGTGDFNGDGVDDVLLQKADGWVGAWLVEDGSVDGFMGICKNTNSIEQIADFNGDGIDDLRIRTATGDIGVLYVNGADDTTWQYLKGVGSEWETKFSALA